jgi:diphosphomevalonate decarboxylase
MKVVAEARSNIALVKYWGKRDAALNLPAAGSLSLTLDGLTTRTSVELDSAFDADRLRLNGQDESGEALLRVSRFLDLVRPSPGLKAHVESTNSFPTASGLASSASAFAALALAAAKSAGLDLSARELSILARRGSGSAARSIFGGLVEMQPGSQPDGRDAYATELLPETAWNDLRLVVAVVGQGAPKAVSSRSGMTHTQTTSPLYPAWLATVPGDLAAARAAIASQDLPRLGEIAEKSALTMHASALGASPGLLYWRGATVEAIHAVRELRRGGIQAYVTIDAGPHVKVLCVESQAEAVEGALGAVPGVSQTLLCRPGRGVQIVP